MKIVFGLGNPESRYNKTPHNVGFAAVDKLCEQLGGKFKKKLNALVCEGEVQGEQVVLVKPLTYMNNSGESVRKFVKKWKIPLENLLIILDDIDLKAGEVRFKESGSAGTHNGMRNIVALLATKDIPRLRIGVGQPDDQTDLSDFVLSKMSPDRAGKVEEGINLAVKQALDFINKVC